MVCSVARRIQGKLRCVHSSGPATRRTTLLLLLASALLEPGPSLARADSWTAPSAITSIAFDPVILADLGLEVLVVRASAVSPGFPGPAFQSLPPSHLEFRAPGGDFERFDAGELLHEGGFVLRLPRGPGKTRVLSLEGVHLRVAPPPDDFHWLDDRGVPAFVLRDVQWKASHREQELQLRNLGIHLSETLARRLGRPDLVDAFVGVANLRLPARLSPALRDGGGGAGGCAETEGPIDVALTALSSISQLAREPGVRVALAPRAALANVGIGSVAWFESIEPSIYEGVGPHPFLSLAMFRLDAGGRLVQLGLADVKHAFFAVNSGCDCAPGNVLYAGCTDVYGVTTNADRQYLAPRDEVTARTGVWERVGSHFDQCRALGPVPCNPATDDADDFRDHGGELPAGLYHDSFEHRLVVPEAALALAGARYFVDAWYLAAGDVDLFNSMGRRRVTPQLGGSTWSFALAAGGLANGSVLDEIPGAVRSLHDTGEGRLQLAVTAEDLGTVLPQYRYRYTLLNFDFDRRIETFTLPLRPGLTVTGIDSTGLGDDPARDWSASLTAGAVSWQAPHGEALDWGALVSFELVVDAEPGPGSVSLAVHEPGTPEVLEWAAPVPAPEPGARLQIAATLLLLAALRGRRRGRSRPAYAPDAAFG
jgi:hypothetical protein